MVNGELNAKTRIINKFIYFLVVSCGRYVKKQKIRFFYKKLFLVADRLHTSSAQKIGHQRIQIMKIYLHDLKLELEI